MPDKDMVAPTAIVAIASVCDVLTARAGAGAMFAGEAAAGVEDIEKARDQWTGLYCTPVCKNVTVATPLESNIET